MGSGNFPICPWGEMQLQWGELQLQWGELQLQWDELQLQWGELQIQWGELQLQWGELQLPNTSTLQNGRVFYDAFNFTLFKSMPRSVYFVSEIISFIYEQDIFTVYEHKLCMFTCVITAHKTSLSIHVINNRGLHCVAPESLWCLPPR